MPGQLAARFRGEWASRVGAARLMGNLHDLPSRLASPDGRVAYGIHTFLQVARLLLCEAGVARRVGWGAESRGSLDKRHGVTVV